MVLKNVRKDKNDILLHVCCGVCAGYPIEKLIAEGETPLAFFSNDNIDSFDEYQRRVESFIKVCDYFGVDYIVDDYNPDDYLERVCGLENEPERGLRCVECIALRLEKTAEQALDMGINRFTTTLVVSPHKNFKKISEIGFNLAQSKDLEFVAIDFKKQDGFLKTNAIAKQLDLYRQNYCGCRFAKGHLKEVENGM